ncbi:MAG: Bax inhibitor-1/YccA family protein [Erysipelotrichaceae bacterium]|nr:Bax inhibitor-1/YccA family protein [Erysipelotrichaceae bacterium]
MKNNLYSKMFMWMFVGLMITFLTGYYVSTNPNMLYNIFATKLYWVIFIAELITVVVLSARIMKMSKNGAIFGFLLYSFITGLTFSSIFVLFKMSSIMFVFLITAVLFLVFALIGYFTKTDLTKLGSILFMGLLGIILASLLNLIFKSESFDLVLIILGIIIFIGYIAYDINKVKRLEGMVDEDKLAIIGALDLYLDFLNLFIRLIQIFGKSNDN